MNISGSDCSRAAARRLPRVCFLLAMTAALSIALCSQARCEPAPKLDGVWRSLGYGYLLAVEGDHFTLYEVTSVSRVEAAEGDLAELARRAGDARLDDDGQHLTILNPGSIAPVHFERLEQLPESDGDGRSADARRQFDVAWQTFEEHYAFFELRGVDWEAQRERWRAGLRADSSDQELFEALADMLRSLGDNHVELRAKGFEFSQPGTLPDVALVRQWRREYETAPNEAGFSRFVREKYKQYIENSTRHLKGMMAGEARQGANNQLLWGMLPDNVGYLKVRQMAGYVADNDADEKAHLAALESEIDRAMADLAGARGMIVDVRFNGGGWDPAAVQIANRFADRRRAAFSKQARTAEGFTEPFTVYVQPAGPRQFTRPTLLLTSPMTASAAEIFTFCMKALPHVKQVGLPTMGIHSDMLERHLSNGWSFSLSNEVYRFIDGKVYEKVGIPPEVELGMFGPDDFRGDRECVVEQAIKLLDQ